MNSYVPRTLSMDVILMVFECSFSVHVGPMQFQKSPGNCISNRKANVSCIDTVTSNNSD